MKSLKRFGVFCGVFAAIIGGFIAVIWVGEKIVAAVQAALNLSPAAAANLIVLLVAAVVVAVAATSLWSRGGAR